MKEPTRYYHFANGDHESSFRGEWVKFDEHQKMKIAYNNIISDVINLLENASPRYDPEAEQDPIDAYVTLHSRVKGAIEKLKELK